MGRGGTRGQGGSFERHIQMEASKGIFRKVAGATQTFGREAKSIPAGSRLRQIGTDRSLHSGECRTHL